MRDWVIQKAQTLETESIRWNKGKVYLAIAHSLTGRFEKAEVYPYILSQTFFVPSATMTLSSLLCYWLLANLFVRISTFPRFIMKTRSGAEGK